MSKYEQPDRRPAVVTGASSGIGAATALVLGAPGFPVALGARRTDQCEEVADAGPGGRRRGRRPPARPDRRRVSVDDFAQAVTAGPRRRRGGRLQRRRRRPGRDPRGRHRAVRAREIDVNLLGAHRLVRAFVPGMVERRRGDVVFVSSDVAVRARPFMAAYAAGKWGLEGMAQAMQMELEGTGVRAEHRAPGPTWSEMGSDLGRPGRRRRAQPVGALRPGPAPALPQARRRIADAIATVVSAPRGVHLNLVEVTPEAPRGGPMDSTLDRARRVARCRGCSPTTRTATCRSCAPTRSGCCTGCARSAATSAASGWPTATSCWSAGPRPTSRSSGRPDEVLDQAAAYPFMTPIFGKGVVFDAPPERRKEMLKNQSLRGEQMTRPRRDHRARDPPDGRRLGRRGRDRPARLLRRADDLHHVGVPDRPARSARSSTAGSRSYYHDLERGTDALAYVDPYADIDVLPPARRRARGAGRAGAGDHRPAHGASRSRAARGARPARRADLAERRGRRRTSPPTRSPACSSR